MEPVNQCEARSTDTHQYESGQAIVLVVLTMVGLLGMLGLAIDGGGLFFLKRDAQNATDAAIVAASYAICTDGDPVEAGLTAAAQNGFTNNGVSDTVTVNYPPKSGEALGKTNYVEVIIDAKKPAYFIQLVYPYPLRVTTYAVGNCSPRFDPTTVPGLWAGSPVCNDTVNWTGSNGKITGSMYSNQQIKFTGSDITIDPGPPSAPLPDTPSVIESSQSFDQSNGDNVTFLNGSYVLHHTNTFKPNPMNLDINWYAPGGAISTNITRLGGRYTPILKNSSQLKNGTWQPKPNEVIGALEGLYYVEGDVKIGNGFTFGAKGITIVATGQILDFSTPAGSLVHYYDLVMAPTLEDLRYPGVMLLSNWAPDPTKHNSCGENAISVSQPNMSLLGVFYAPNAGVNLSGSSMRFEGVILANTIDFSGSEGQFIYNKTLLPPRPPIVKVAE